MTNLFFTNKFNLIISKNTSKSYYFFWIILTKLSTKNSTSCFVLSFPKVVLKVPSDKFLSKPIATNTCDGSGFPVLQAEPADAHIPFSSNSSSNFCAFIFGNEKFEEKFIDLCGEKVFKDTINVFDKLLELGEINERYIVD